MEILNKLSDNYEIVKKLKATGAQLIFATTTPYPEGTKPLRAFGDEIKYNRAAIKIMKKNDIEINDLHSFVKPRMQELQRPVNVHFTEYGSKEIAAQVAQWITNKLENAASTITKPTSSHKDDNINAFAFFI